MANVLREECEQLDGGSFEKVTDFDSELEDETLGDGLPSDGSPVVPAGAVSPLLLLALHSESSLVTLLNTVYSLRLWLKLLSVD